MGVNVVMVATPLDGLILEQGGRRGGGKTENWSFKNVSVQFSIPDVKVTVTQWQC